MRPITSHVEDKVTAAREAAISSISTSLIPLIFRDLDKSGRPLPSAFKIHVLPRTAAHACKFAGLLVQAYWYLLKSKKQEEEIPNQLNDILLQMWAGHQRYSEGLAVSLLHEASLAPKSSSLHRLVNSPETFVRWGELMLHREGRYKGLLNEYGKLDLYDYFARLIKALPILQSAHFDGSQFIFDSGAVPKIPFIYNSAQCRNTLYLYTFEQVQSKPAIVFEDPYSDYTEELAIDDLPGLADQYYTMRQVLGFKDVRQGMLYLFGSGYKHIKNLALAIANTPGRALDNFIEDHRRSYSQVSPEEDKEGFITLALADLGPTKVLKQIFRYNRDLLDEYLSYFEMRALGRASDWQQEFNSQLEGRLKNVEAFLELDDELRKQVCDRIDMDARCWCAIKAAGLKIDTPHDYVESIGVRIRMLENFTNYYRNNEYDVLTIGIKIAKLVERTFKFLICFYSGLNGYYRAFENNQTDYHKCEEAMLSESKKAYRKVSGATPGTLVSEFRELCARMSNKGATDLLLGRSQVCDISKFNRKLVTNEWISIFNRLKHDKAKEVTPTEMIDFVDQTVSLFKFFRDGKELSKVKAIFEGVPIYPMVVSFREQHRKRDGLIIYNYKIHSLDGTETGYDIKILTPHEYVPNEEYYCIPFYKRSTSEWLLDPFLIRCSKLNAVLTEVH